MQINAPQDGQSTTAPAPVSKGRGLAVTGGFFTNRRIHRILTLAGLRPSLVPPKDAAGALAWGMSPYAKRTEQIALRHSLPLIRVEEAFLRGLQPGRSGEAPLGLVIDHSGIYFDARRPSDLETLLRHNPLDDAALLNRARAVVARMQRNHISKFSTTDPNLPAPPAGYVLVIDQTQNDASIAGAMANKSHFTEMLATAQADHPHARILVKTHPETRHGYRMGHFSAGPMHGFDANMTLVDSNHSPWVLLEGAIAVYTVSSTMGFEAILAGHRPVTFGAPFYAGWGLTDDRLGPIARRGRTLSRAQLAAAALILYPTWYDPHHDRLCEVEAVLGHLEARARAWREDRDGYTAYRISKWKRAHMRRFFHGPLRFASGTATAATTGRPMVWAAHSERTEHLLRVEDGFIRSNGLGAQLIPPLSLICDDLGIHYDPSRPSRLEVLITAASPLPEALRGRVEDLIQLIRKQGITKYGLSSPITPALPPRDDRMRVLIAGQVSDDASIRHGAGEIRDDLALIEAARIRFPEACLIYKPHPDVIAGLRRGGADAARLVDHIITTGSPAKLLDEIDRVMTISSTFGFEALLRGVPVTTAGMPFYAGWGLTDDLLPHPERRKGVRPDLLSLTHAALIAYPRYYDPVINSPCSVEVAIARMADVPRRGTVLALMDRLNRLRKAL